MNYLVLDGWQGVQHAVLPHHEAQPGAGVVEVVVLPGPGAGDAHGVEPGAPEAGEAAFDGSLRADESEWVGRDPTGSPDEEAALVEVQREAAGGPVGRDAAEADQPPEDDGVASSHREAIVVGRAVGVGPPSPRVGDAESYAGRPGVIASARVGARHLVPAGGGRRFEKGRGARLGCQPAPDPRDGLRQVDRDVTVAALEPGPHRGHPPRLKGGDAQVAPRTRGWRGSWPRDATGCGGPVPSVGGVGHEVAAPGSPGPARGGHGGKGRTAQDHVVTPCRERQGHAHGLEHRLTGGDDLSVD